MATVMKASEFIEKLKDVANNYKTLYVMGCFGAPMTAANKKRWIEKEHYSYNNKVARTKFINAASTDTFGFDCVNLIKAILWGWSGDKSKTYGGAKYKTNGVPDVNADGMIKLCSPRLWLVKPSGVRVTLAFILVMVWPLNVLPLGRTKFRLPL